MNVINLNLTIRGDLKKYLTRYVAVGRFYQHSPSPSPPKLHLRTHQEEEKNKVEEEEEPSTIIMGGDSVVSNDQDSLLEEDFTLLSSHSPAALRDNRVNVENGSDVGETSEEWCSSRFDFEVNERKTLSAYEEISQSYDRFAIDSKNLKHVKEKILSYKPGAWIENVGGLQTCDYDVPKTTCLLLVGPGGSGKSSMINRISKVLEDDKFAPARAQVSYNLLTGDGTYFLQEYMIPRHSTSICLCDTRSLSDNSNENENDRVLKSWMTKGVRHGELVVRKTDSRILKKSLKCKARKNGFISSKIRKVNFVIYVVNGLSVLKSMKDTGARERQYIETIVQTFNSPFLSFKGIFKTIICFSIILFLPSAYIYELRSIITNVCAENLLSVSSINLMYIYSNSSPLLRTCGLISPMGYGLHSSLLALQHKNCLCVVYVLMSQNQPLICPSGNLNNNVNDCWKNSNTFVSFLQPKQVFRLFLLADDKPVLVFTHGDLLSLLDRVRVRAYLGELLGIPPTIQIFDIPDCDDLATESTIIEMLRYSLEHAERNFPRQSKVLGKVDTKFLFCVVLSILVLAVAVVMAYDMLPQLCHVLQQQAGRKKYPARLKKLKVPEMEFKIDWHKIRYIW
ncbi:hypothetical protein Ahy_A07g036860 isoform A [Arachis hypogaea]|uniref:G domain-containing protein n=1 Tax=Arachis hypogaea TaxID=3818 RepID=A0A445CH60_ARAHY|nr:hypothetical protein Ahy_A07g036860 isoform A [Arachis hypogaea]